MRPRDAVRLRPAMYIGYLDARGLEQMLWEVVGNAIDQHLAYRATEVAVELDTTTGWVSVRDDGPGISVEPYGDDQVPLLEQVCTRVLTSPTFDGHVPHVHVTGGLYGAGLAVVCALSARFEIETTPGGVRWAQAFERGLPVGPIARLGETALEGTTVRFLPDREIFGDAAFDLAQVEARLQELAWLNPRFRMSLQGRRLRWRGGIAGWLAETAPVAYAVHRRIVDVEVELALGWAGDGDPAIRSFVNSVATTGGTHVAGLWEGLGAWAEALGVAKREAIERARIELARGLSAIVHVGLYSPEYDNPMKAHLASPIAARAVKEAMERDSSRVIEGNTALRRYLCERLGCVS